MSTPNGTLNIARLIEEAEAQLMGETPKSCTNCGNCKTAGNGERSCADRANAKTAIRRPLVPTARR